MKILSLFDGMACGMIAMKLAGVDVESYDAYEIDKYAVKTAQHNFPMIREHGDVFTADFAQYEGADFLVGGSPCTHWSIAQTQNRETTVSRDEKGQILLHSSGIGFELFSQYLRALDEAKPKYFLYENNKSMSKDIRAAITECFGFEPVCINSALVSAQNRQRLYWVGRRNADGTYSKVNVEQPEDRGILLKDVLDSAVAMREKGHAVIGSAARTTERECCIKNQGNMVAEPICVPKYGSENKSRPVYEVRDGKITIKGKQYPIKLRDGYYIIRKLTVTECKRLQTVPEWYDFSCVSNSQAYKMLGNGWTCEVIAHLIRSCICPSGEKTEETEWGTQYTMFLGGKMMDLIDRSDLLRLLDECIADGNAQTPITDAVLLAIKCAVEQMPKADAVPVRHGHWTKDGDCSECGMPIPTDDRVDCIFRDEVAYCCYCGAKMDKEPRLNASALLFPPGSRL